jgi:hypothetical protein
MMPPLWKCSRRVGFLFPHPCTRTTSVGCPDCQNGQIDDPFSRRLDRYTYLDYDDYDDSLLDIIPGFTEADGESLVTPDDESDDFENDLSAS